ncbi:MULTISPECIES: YbjO family protein [Dickeya]|uniref:Inner membrane protein n=1 Tax=Dickeya aquatica TaxID=1401087 RepID=A0A375AAI4_9GAMM|nr:MULTISPECIES: YbjO family protein [Dickeya]SLM62961.1 Putative inner membrane protein [Dickeya aquatica]
MQHIKREVLRRSLFAPVAVMVAGSAIIATRCLSVMLTISELGISGFGGWLSSSARQWDSTLVLLAALLVLCVEIRCGFAVLSGVNWGRWCFLLTQCLVTVYMLLASLLEFLPPVFHVSGDGAGEVLNQLFMQRLPDFLLILLLFIPRRSQRFFMPHP